MLPTPFFNRKAADSSIMTYCNRTAYLMFHDTMPKMVDAPLTLTFITSKQPLYNQSLYATNQIHSYDIHYCVCIYYRLHPGVLLPLNFWSTGIYAIWVRNDVALSHSCAFGRQLTACELFNYFLVNIARLPHNFLSSSFSSISMTYHKQFQRSQPCAPGLCRKLCSWIHGWIWHDGCRLDWFVMRPDRSSYDTYDITHLNFVITFRH